MRYIYYFIITLDKLIKKRYKFFVISDKDYIYNYI